MRTPDEKSHIICYLKFKVPFFESFDRDLVSMIGDKLAVKFFSEGDLSNHFLINMLLVIRKGDEGDCLYILYQGDVNVIAGDEDKITVVLREN